MCTIKAVRVLFFLVVFLTVTNSIAASKKEALEVAEHWLALLDDNKIGTCYDEASPLIKKAINRQQFIDKINAVRKQLGPIRSRQLELISAQTQLPGVPEGHYVVIQFISALANDKTAVETITPSLGDDKKWRIAGYYIRLAN